MQVIIDQEYLYIETRYYTVEDELPENFSTWPIDVQARYIDDNYEQDDYEAEPMGGRDVLSVMIEQ